MNTQKCAAYLKQHQDDIFASWEKRANEEVLAASKNPNLIVRNYLPYFMEHLIAALESYNGNKNEQQFAGMKFEAKYSQEHGRSRATVMHYDIRQVITEYAILRQILRNRLLEEKLLCFTSQEIINRFVEASCAEAGQLFMDSIREVQEKLIGVIAHDLRNPISTGLAYVEVGELGLMPNEGVFEALKRSLTRSVKLIEELLDASQVEAGNGMTFRFEKTDIAEQLGAACKEANEIYNNPIQFDKTGTGTEGIYDHTSIQRAVENLMSNAVKYGSFTAPVTVKIEGDEKLVVVSVHNEGSYIEPDKQETIFNFLSREEDQRKQGKKGWGLGLYLVKMVAQAHKGRAWVESDKELGTTFYIQLSRAAHPQGTAFSQVLK